MAKLLLVRRYYYYYYYYDSLPAQRQVTKRISRVCSTPYRAP
jgi:hypothetical protein